MSSGARTKGAFFKVDTHLFRELGRLLVGRESTALSELIKNAYDADASFVRVYGYSLGDPEKGFIRVSDDGIGITESEFTEGFLRIASRFRQTQTRRSSRFNRRYTGAKGIGRLAAHKLASYLDVRSIPGHRSDRKRRPGIHATIDWNRIEEYALLDDAEDAIEIAPLNLDSNKDIGTTLTLSRIRRPWGEARRTTFVFEAASLQPPEFLVRALPKDILAKPLLFKQPNVRDIVNTDPGFRVEFSGDFDLGEDYWTLLGGEASWIVEIKASPDKGLRAAIAPAVRTQLDLPDASPMTFEREPFSKSGPFFDARFVVREGRATNESVRDFARRNSGIRVYMEGFRVLPYGDPKDDWLDIQASNIARTSSFFTLTDAIPIEGPDRPELTALPQSNYHGAVFLTEANSAGLEMLVNREGFVESPAFDALVNSLRWGIELFIRTRAAATYTKRQRRKTERQTTGATSANALTAAKRTHPTFATAEAASELAEDAIAAVRKARSEVTRRGPAAAADAVGALELELTSLLKAYHQTAADELSLLRLLASIGTQMAAFVHETRGLLGIVITLEEGLRKLHDSVDERGLRLVRSLQRSLSDLRANLDRQVAYLTDVASVDARRRRSRQSVRDSFERVMRLFAQQAADRDIRIANNIPEELRTVPMFAAELRTVISNLLSNALRAAGRGGRIKATAALRDGTITFQIENTGRAVNLKTSERWFQPFESSSVDIDKELGQGMGLGLPITRATLQPYNAEIRFVTPHAGFRTAIRITIPGS